MFKFKLRSLTKNFENAFSTQNKLKSPLLTRDFIYDRLYSPQQGYFTQKNVQIGEMKKAINFKNLLGYSDYQKELIENYPKDAWLTPSEIFKPYYGMAIGNYIHQLMEYNRMKTEQYEKIQIIEVGAGAASAAQSILMFFQNYEQKYFKDLEYTIVELSPTMCQRAKEKLSIDYQNKLDKGQIKIINEDFKKFRPEDPKTLYFLIFLEVLDNMPHDRVFYNPSTKKWDKQGIVEFSDESGNENLKEKQVDLEDPVIKLVLDQFIKMPLSEFQEVQFRKQDKLLQRIVNWYYKSDQNNVFLPTFCYQLLEHIQKNYPNHHLIMADFDSLGASACTKQGINAPVVSQKGALSFEKKDFQNYLVQRGEADIFFPTNFHLLQRLYKKATGKKGDIYKSYQFMKDFSREQWTETKSGYNPLKEDFLNTSFFVTNVK